MSDLIAFYGGTFSPPHLGHIHAACVFSAVVKPSKLLIIPTAVPPHKQSVIGASDEDRMNMCLLAFADVAGAEVSDLEFRRGGKSYTADTIATLKQNGSHVAMLIGTDMLLTLDTWYNPSYIFENADLYCIRRESDAEIAARIDEKNREYEKRFGRRVILIDSDVLPMSSTAIRDAIRNGEYTQYLTPSVASYIEERGLYK